MCVYVCMSVCLYECMCTWQCLCVCACMRACVFMCLRVCAESAQSQKSMLDLLELELEMFERSSLSHGVWIQTPDLMIA